MLPARSDYLDIRRFVGYSLEVDERLAVWSRVKRPTYHVWVLRRTTT